MVLMKYLYLIDYIINLQAAKVFSRSFLRMQKTWSRVNDKMVYSTALEKVEREIALMKRLRHPNLVSLVDVIDDEEEDQYMNTLLFMIRIFMMLDYVENGQVMYYDPSTYQFTSKLAGFEINIVVLINRWCFT